MMPLGAGDEILYASVTSGEISIDAQGRLWRHMLKVWNRNTNSMDLHPCEMRRAESASGDYFTLRAMYNGRRWICAAHRLVWRHFFGPIPAGLTINHKNGRKRENCPENLELATYSDQAVHARQVLYGGGDAYNVSGERNPMAKLTREQAREIRRRRLGGEPRDAIAHDFGVSGPTVSYIALGKTWVESGKER